MFTSEQPNSNSVLQQSSTTTPPSVLSQGMTEKEREIFYRLLIDLFVDNPKRKRPQVQAHERKENQ